MKSQSQPRKKKQRTAALGHDSEMDCVAMKQPVGFFGGPVVLEDSPLIVFWKLLVLVPDIRTSKT